MIPRAFLPLLLTLLMVPAWGAAMVSPSPPEEVVDLRSANAALEAAHLAFERGDAGEAMELYLRVVEAGYPSASIWTNAGTAAWRAGRPGEAVLYYKRALRLDPTYSRALQSLEYVSPATNVSQESLRNNLLAALLRYTTPGQWFLAAQVLFLLGCIAIARSMASPNPDTRGHWVAILAWSLVFCLGAGAVGWINHSARMGGSEAVVMRDGATTRSEPREEATEQLELPAGTILEILESPRRGFVRVRGADGSTGFISTDSIARI